MIKPKKKLSREIHLPRVRCTLLENQYIQYNTTTTRTIAKSCCPKLTSFWQMLAYNAGHGSLRIRYIYICMICGAVFYLKRTLINHIPHEHHQMELWLKSFCLNKKDIVKDYKPRAVVGGVATGLSISRNVPQNQR